MSINADRPGDEQFAARDIDPVSDLPQSAQDAYAESHTDPAMAPVIEAGGGVSEGFEESEALLVEHATQGGLDSTMRILLDARGSDPEAGPERGTYGEPDHERSSEKESD
jgi:hypothetical protein